VIVVTACYGIETRWMTRRPGVILVCTPVGDRAPDALRSLSESHIDILLSTGFCGALQSQLRTGDLVLADRVEHLGEIIHIEPSLVARTQDAFNGHGLSASCGRTVCVSQVTGREDKASLAQNGALSVDMESSPLARWAEERDVPFLSLRVVLDEVDADVPFSAEDSLLRSLVSHPLAAIRTGRWAARAGRSLGSALDVLVGALEEGR